MSDLDSSKANAVSMGISFLAAAVWAVYGVTGAPTWLLVVGIVFSLFTGWWWAFGRRAFFPDVTGIGDRQRDRDRRGD